jgi:hypothetical protein
MAGEDVMIAWQGGVEWMFLDSQCMVILTSVSALRCAKGGGM